MARILIADAYEVVRVGLRKIAEAHISWEVVSEAADGVQAVRMATETQPDVAILGYALPLLDGIEATRRIRALIPKTEVLIFTVHESDVLIQEAIKAGACGYLLKSDPSHLLVAAIEALTFHKPFFTACASETLLRSLQGGRAEKPVLTNRECDVVRLIAEGHANKEVARYLNISLKTVETHRATIMRKLKLSSSAALVRYAVRNNLVAP
jgi:DNA-binding NarL/FixJ family response regulator